MAANRAKRRDLSQRVGRQGEIIFDGWATENHLIANKLDEDYGIDFICQEAETVKARTEEITGRSVHVQVRASSGARTPRVSVDRVDVETALRQEAPYCLVAVRMTKKSVHFRFLDEALATKWAEFLAGTANSTSFRLDEMDADPTIFIEELRRVSRPAFREKLARTKVANALSAVMPGSRLHINSGIDGEWAVVAAPRIGNIFDVKTPAERELLASTIFSPSGFEQVLTHALNKFKLKPALTRIADLTDGPVLLATPVEQEVTLALAGKNGKVTTQAKVRRIEDERAYVLESGLVIRISDARLGDDGRHYHHFSSNIVEENAHSLDSTPDLAFLKGLAPGATFNEDGRPGIPVEDFHLEGIGPAIRALEAVYTTLDIPLTEAKLADLTDQVLCSNLGLIEALLLQKPKAFPIPGFVFGIPSGQSFDDTNWVSCAYQVPIVMRLKNRGIMVWLTGEGAAYMPVPNGPIHGFRFGRPVDVLSEKANFEVLGDGMAAAYVIADWPALPLRVTETEVKVQRNGTLPVEGKFIFESDGYLIR